MCASFPQLTDALLAHFNKVCPYTVPYYIPKIQGQTDGQWLVALGYKKKSGATDDNDVNSYEAEESYYERMAGLIRLYAAFMQIDYPGNHPHGLSNAWSWMARIMNMKPRKITATMILAFIEVRSVNWISTVGFVEPKQFLWLNKTNC